MRPILPGCDDRRVHIPRFNALEDADEMRALVAAVGSAQLVTTRADGYPAASMLPILWDEDDARLVMHMAKANQHWKSIEPDTPGLAVVTGAEAYVSPAWYATKAEHGKVVPTWNYSAIHFTGRVTAHHDADWLREAVTRLTDELEGRRGAAGREAWSVDDAPAKYVTGQLRAIVGIEMVVERVEAKVKLSQNRSDADRAGVVAGLRAEGGRREAEVADRMAEDLLPRASQASGISSQAST
jgi:transcriptional regulator